MFSRTPAQRFRSKIVAGSAAEFVAAKLAERDERHVRVGDSRYVVEPNVKDGKGGLRDLHTLYWIGKYVHDVERPADLVSVGLLTADEFASFERAERFLWAVRCHLHLEAGRPEERLSFQYQKQIAQRMRYADRPGKSAVERFMHFYFLNAKTVGDLTGVFLAQLDEQKGRSGFRFALPTIRRRPRRLSGFVLERGRLSIPSDDFFAEDPIRLLELFALAARERLEIHPTAMRAATRDARLIKAKVRKDPRANELFMEVLTNLHSPDIVLRWMNEAGVFGRFIPDFGRVVAQMQFDMYHHYTVDEHAIRAIGLLAAIERGELADDHPLSTALFKQIASRRVLYVAVLLHDIAKGRGGDHSVLGEQVALDLCPRLGLDQAETETVAWLVRYHLLMSAAAFKRDLADPKTIEDFVGRVQSPERLRLLLMLTVVDIRAVGPGVWNDWKRLLLRTLFDSAEEKLRLGHKQRGRSEIVAERQLALAGMLGWNAKAARANAKRLPDSYWLAEPADVQLSNALQIASSEARIGEGGAERRRRPRARPRGRPGQRVCARPRRPVLPDLRGPGGGRRQHHRRARPHHPRRHGARQFRRPGRAGRGLRRQTAARPVGEIGSSGAGQRLAARAAEAEGGPGHPVPHRPRRRHRRPGVEPDDGRRGQRARPAGAAGAAGASDPPLRACGPFGAYRHLRRARGRRLLFDRPDRA